MMGPLGSPPGDQQELAGHPRCSIGREVNHGRGDVIWDAHPSQGDGGLDLVQLVVNVKYLSECLGDHRPGCNGIDANRRREFKGQGLGQVVHPSFRGCIGAGER